MSNYVATSRKVGKTFVGRQIDQRSTLLGNRICASAATLREVGAEFEKRGEGKYVVRATETIAGYVDRVGHYLERSDAATLGRDAESFAVRQPGLASAVALAAGFVAARVVRVATTSGPLGRNG